ncbi:MAG: acylphosphatase [Bacteroidota bacterium]
MIRHYNITVKGKVQGVFYRQSTAETARQLGINGFVRNEANGDVYIEAEGTEEMLGKLAAWCRKGPPRAEVREVITREGPVKPFSSFEIRR